MAHVLLDSGFPWLRPAWPCCSPDRAVSTSSARTSASMSSARRRRFPTSGKPDVSLATFDGSIEVRPWDRPEVQVVIEKRGRDKAAADEIDIRTEQNGNRIIVDVKPRKGSEHRGLNFGWNMSRSAKLIVSMPATSDLSAKSGDGSIDVERITGRVEMRSGDGSIRAHDSAGT